jgi:hypothetical protein
MPHDPALEAERFRPALARLLSVRQSTYVDLGTRRSIAKLADDCKEAIRFYRENPRFFPEVLEWSKCIKVYREAHGITLHLIGWHNDRPWNTNILPPSNPPTTLVQPVATVTQ